jgi:hypothetical protein
LGSALWGILVTVRCLETGSRAVVCRCEPGVHGEQPWWQEERDQSDLKEALPQLRWTARKVDGTLVVPLVVSPPAGIVEGEGEQPQVRRMDGWTGQRQEPLYNLDDTTQQSPNKRPCLIAGGS